MAVGRGGDAAAHGPGHHQAHAKGHQAHGEQQELDHPQQQQQQPLGIHQAATPLHGRHPGAVLQQGDLGDELLVHAVIQQGHEHQPQQQDHQQAHQQQWQSEGGLRELEAAPFQQPGHPDGPRQHHHYHQQRDRQQGGQGDPGPEHPAEPQSIPAQQASQGGTFPRQGLPGATDHAHIPPAAHRQAGGQTHQEQQPVANPQGFAPGTPQHLLLKRLQQDL